MSAATRESGPVAALEPSRPGGWRQWIAPGLALTVFTLAMLVLRAELNAHAYHDIERAVRAIPAAQRAKALLFTVIAFAALALYDLLALEYVGRLRRGSTAGSPVTPGGDGAGPPTGIGFRRAGFAGLIAYGVSQTLGFPAVTGAAVRYRFWSSWGLSTPEIARAASFVGATFTLGLVLVGGLALVLEPATELTALHVPPRDARAVGVLLLLAVMTFLAWSIHAGGRSVHLPNAVTRFRSGSQRWTFDVPRPRFAFAQAAVALVDWAAAAAVLWVLLPASVRPPFAAFAGLFVVAQLAGILSHVPGGLGVFDTLIVLGLRPYLPAGPVLAALVAYRAVYYLLPFAAALLLFAGYEAQRRLTHHRGFMMIATRTAGTVRATAQSTGSVVAALGYTLVPTAVAAAVFAAGSILLISGATPSIRPRVTALHHLLPEGVMELSHLLGSVAGALLLVLAWALRRRLDAAWMTTVVLLSAGVVLSLLKGFDWEEAALLLPVLGTVLLFRRAFYRRAALTAEPLEPGWVVAIVTVMGLTTWIGLLSFRHVELASDVWWRVRPHADAPRFLRATLASAVVLASLAVARLLRPGRLAATLPDEAQVARAATVAANCADTESYLALLGDKALLFPDTPEIMADAQGRAADVPTVDGFVQYGVAGKSWIAMGDPMVADSANGTAGRELDTDDAMRVRSALAWRFKTNADANGGWPVFYEVSAEMLPLYIDLGLTFLKLGELARVDLDGFSLDGGSRKSLRRAIKDIEGDGAQFEVVPVEQVQGIMPALRTISDEWLANKCVREKGFSLGYFDEAYLQRCPIAVVRASPGTGDDGSDIVAFANILRGGGREELSVDLMRFTARAPKGVMDYLFVKLMLWGKAEGYRSFNLGMAPLAGLEARALAPLWSRAGSWLYRHGEHFYNYKGIRRYKEKFDPVWEPRYLASPGGVALPRILVNVAAIISGGLTGVVRK